jgi:hypothetical protein
MLLLCASYLMARSAKYQPMAPVQLLLTDVEIRYGPNPQPAGWTGAAIRSFERDAIRA